ncbi:hypothetical protein GC194_08530 [bacterium]|nr:hypothetical protein [bacterium]
MKYRKILHLSLVFTVCACANQVALTGGDKDSTPPKVLESSPPNGSVNFDGDVIKISFDELIQIQNQAQIVVSPLMDETPKFVFSGKNVVVRFQEKLRDSTTYRIDFRNALVDYNESNPLADYSYVFSTGTFLDSLVLSGKVSNYLDDKEKQKDVLVGLYTTTTNLLDSLRPLYISRADESGNFVLNNIAYGKYFLAAIKDDNRDFKLQANELFAFKSEFINLTKNLDSIPLYLTQSRNIIPGATGIDGLFPNAIVVFSKPVSHLQMETPDGIAIDFNLNASGDTAFIKKKIEFDKIVLNSNLLNNDTLTISKAKKADDDNKELRVSLGSEKIRGNRIWVKASLPVQSYNNKGFHLFKDSTEVPINSLKLNTRNVFEITFQRTEELNGLRIVVDSAAVKSGEKVNSKYDWPVAFAGESTMASMGFVLPADVHDNLLIELRDDKDQLVRLIHVKDETEIIFNKLYEGNYNLRVVVDENNNGIWDSADFEKLQQPEKIYNFGPFKLEGGWDLLGNKLEFN